MLVSVVIPAFDEEAYLGATLASVGRAAACLSEKAGVSAEVFVVDNDSSDSTAAVARGCGAVVVRQARHNVARVRNTGARFAGGDVLVFVAADTVVPEELLWRVVEALAEPGCLGGAVDTDYGPAKLTSKIYLWFWRVAGKLLGMAQGATQFCRRDAFDAPLRPVATLAHAGLDEPALHPALPPHKVGVARLVRACAALTP